MSILSSRAHHPAADNGIDILLGVYNGAMYLDAAIASVQAQTHENWTLLVRDDGSTDATPQILAAWQERLGGRMQILPNPERLNLGMNGNYAALLAASTSPYVTQISHDDLYHPDRLTLILAALRAREAECPAGRPVLAYSDQRIIDESGAVTAPSLWALTGWRPPRKHLFGHLLVHSAIYGGTILANRPLADLVKAPSQRAKVLNEDTRFAWLAAACGELVPIEMQTVDFRRHTSNQSRLISFRSTLALLQEPLRIRRVLHERLEQLRPEVRAFLAEFGGLLPLAEHQTAQAFLDLPNLSPLDRRRMILRHGLLYSSLIRNLGLLALA